MIPTMDPIPDAPLGIRHDWYEEECGLSRRIEILGIPFALIPAGTFRMGSPDGEYGRYADEGPVHQVQITRPFYLGVTPVTQEQHERVMGSNPSHFKGKNLPVETVSWDDCQAFCAKMAELTGEQIRLPSEAQWEYACRAGTRTRFSFGDDEEDLDDYAWHYGNSKSCAHPVGQKLPNPWGLYDMHGNVWEWCEDVYGLYLEGEHRSDPPIAQTGCSGAAAGARTAGSAGRRPASGSRRRSGTTTSVSVRPSEGEQGSDPTGPRLACFAAGAGASTAGAAGQRTASASCRTPGTSSTGSGWPQNANGARVVCGFRRLE
jgi:formylglycine-generating enzyme required for sulfatase activity